MQPIEQLSYILPTFSFVVDRIEPMQLHDPTPCSKFTVHDVLDHMIVLGGSFTYWFRGEPAPELRPPPVYGWVPAAEVRKVLDDLLDATRSPGAMERTISAPIGELPGETFARFVALDGLLHGWDLSRATGLSFEVSSPVVAAVDEFAREALTDELRATGAFAGEVTAPDGASRLDSLAAFSGRTI